MFGYVTINQSSLKDGETDIYRMFYCGLCEALRERYGTAGRAVLSYDMTFLVMLLSGVYDTETKQENFRCVVHPGKNQKRAINEFSYYCADMTVLLAYYKCLDDKNDENSLKGRAGAFMLKKYALAVADKYPEKAENIKTYLNGINSAEKSQTDNIDLISGLFGKIMEEIFDLKNDIWSPVLRKMGFYLGKFIYIMDAYEDVEDDIKKGSFNIFKDKFKEDGFDDYCARLLNMMMAESAQAFELLPIVDNIEILRNIIYAGVWTKFEAVKAKRKDKYGPV